MFDISLCSLMTFLLDFILGFFGIFSYHLEAEWPSISYCLLHYKSVAVKNNIQIGVYDV